MILDIFKSGGTYTGAPVCLFVLEIIFKKRFRDYLTLRYFPQRLVSEFNILLLFLNELVCLLG
jgi:hypothetical protein